LSADDDPIKIFIHGVQMYANACVFVMHVGLCPDWQDWNPVNNVQNATEAMDAAEQWLDVPQVYTDLYQLLLQCRSPAGPS